MPGPVRLLGNSKQAQMQADPNTILTINGAQYDGSQLPPEGKKLVALLQEAQNEIARLEIRRELLQASQQQLLNLLKPLLPEPNQGTNPPAVKVLGEASATIPTTPVTPPDEQPAPFPENLPEAFRARP